MSRLIVKNLPLSITEGKLRNNFAKHGNITDLQLKYKDGKFRGFGFIGFSTEDEGKAAKSYLDGTFIGAAKIKVEFCSELGKSEKKKKKAVESNDSLPSRENTKTVEEGIDKYKNDPKFKEFLSVHSKKESWDNNAPKIDNDAVAKTDAETPASENENEDNAEQEEETGKTESISDIDYLKSKKKPKEPKPKKILFTVKLSGLPFKSKKKDLKPFFAPLKPASIRVPPKIKGIAFVGFLTEKEQKTALNKHKSFLGEHQINVLYHKEREQAEDSHQSKWTQQEASLDGVESVGESGRIFIRNLPYSATEDDISSLFSKFGPLSETTVPVDRNTRKYKGFAFVTFMMPEHAVKAFSELDGSTFMGRLVHLLPAKPKEDDGEGGEGGEGSDFKKNKDAKLKASASNSYNWNSLFLDVNAVADVMAAEYGVDKSKVMMEDGRKGTSAAVKLALGETEIVGQTRDFLEQQGVRLDAFSRKPDKRSKTVILAKNLPAKTVSEQLRDKFSVFGVINRLVMPSHSLTAIIEFADPSEARTAFRKLAYTKFHNAPLYLEWAPEDTFVTPFSQDDDTEESSQKETVEEKQEEVREESDEPEEGSTLFVKNLNFNTSDSELLEHFKPCGSVHSATVATKKNTKTDEVLSMGFGFVSFLLKASAEKALKTLQHSRLAGHCLELKRSTRATTSQQETDRQKADLGKPSTKLLVRNIPFQAKKEEIAQLFRTFGELSAVRLPSKLAGTGDHRGFAFIEFSSLSDAKTAFKSLVHSTHLYGRRLVLEWAQGEQTLEELRDKTRKHWGDGRTDNSKRTKFDFEKDE